MNDTGELGRDLIARVAAVAGGLRDRIMTTSEMADMERLAAVVAEVEAQVQAASAGDSAEPTS